MSEDTGDIIDLKSRAYRARARAEEKEKEKERRLRALEASLKQAAINFAKIEADIMELTHLTNNHLALFHQFLSALNKSGFKFK